MRMDEHTHGTLRFWREATATHDIKFAAGKLQVPGAVDRQRDVVAQRAVSKGRGDDAGHLIAHQFGGPEAPYNLSIQNYRQNQGGGTYWDLEQRWASQLKNGVEIDVTVREMSRKGEDRPYHRHVSWLETHKDSLVLGELDFVNTMSPKGRSAEGIPKVEYDNPAKIVDLTKMQRSEASGDNSIHPLCKSPSGLRQTNTRRNSALGSSRRTWNQFVQVAVWSGENRDSDVSNWTARPER